MKKNLLTLLMFLTLHSLWAQESPQPVKNPPVNLETLISDRGVSVDLMVNKKFQSIPRLGFFSVTNVVGEWDQREIKDLMTQGQLTYQIIKGLDVLAGFHVTNVTGFRPTAGLMYSYKTPEFLLVVSPRVDLMKDGVIEGLTILEYTPKINDNWNLYTRLQALYGQNLNPDSHARSYIQARAGVNYKEFKFGVGTNLDRYGPMKENINSFGAFLGVALF
ncbi:hypothetical protein NLM59_07435 [Weeksellaceae bacterium KMM 9724]|uniref:hypothetical protein n=1 Tax=Profundicola chukchiensis TaxID=2961959 RepID=UPI00243AB868|nr:hypothetical protein [Profundicola chukchiensis]MDG4950753.1 hypothetical protein [Profundicola chukchiensis]